MNKIEKLIEKLCPEGVIYKELREIAIISGAGVDKKIKQDEKKVKLLNYMDVYRHKYLNRNIPSMEVTANDNKISGCNILKGDIFITPSSEVLNDIGNSAVAIEDFPEAVYSYHIMRIRLNIYNITTSMFINYVFESDFIQKQINRNAKGITRFGLTKTQWEKLQIPIPPLPIQEEIVSILDKFTLLEAELEAELEARKTQYEYYREKLLTFPEGRIENGEGRVDWKTLGEVFNIKNGYTPSKAKPEFWTDGNIPWFRMEDIRENGRVLSDSIQHVSEGAVKSGGLFSKDSIIISTTATIGEHALITTPFIMNQQLTALTVNNEYKTKLDPKYAFYYCYIIGDECRKQVNPGGFALINNAKIKKLQIPIPPLSIQEEIVAILDRFDALVNDISVGLPAEIEARRKQYEYYREKLLTFPELRVEN